jgi:hypothetical protein
LCGASGGAGLADQIAERGVGSSTRGEPHIRVPI